MMTEYDQIETELMQMASVQRDKILALGRRIIPTLTPEDMLQPNDYPELENHPHFRYEEGILEGLLTVLAAVRAKRADLSLQPL
jgi:hypothetical protein